MQDNTNVRTTSACSRLNEGEAGIYWIGYAFVPTGRCTAVRYVVAKAQEGAAK